MDTLYIDVVVHDRDIYKIYKCVFWLFLLDRRDDG